MNGGNMIILILFIGQITISTANGQNSTDDNRLINISFF